MVVASMSEITWQDAALRLALAALSGAAIGFDRGEHGRPAGLRTTMLVCLAAAITMVQANLLLFTRGRPPDAFTGMDVMRLPLGILSGVGFIGAGAILRRKGEFVHGVTTAATLWYVTVMGLCFGGGQIYLGFAALGLGLLVLWGLKLFEQRCRQEYRAWLTVEASGNEWSPETIARRLDAGFSARRWMVDYSDQAQRCILRCEVRWRARPTTDFPPDFVRALARESDIIRAEWKP